jgi:glycosyltransferase involved in cell wall biosynthesis
MNVILIGIFADERLIPKINALSNASSLVSISAIKYSKLIYDGLKMHLGNNCVGFFLAPIGMYPNAKTLIFLSRKIDSYYYIPFVNIIILKQISIAISVTFFVARWYFHNRGEKVAIIFTSLYLPFLVPFIFLKWITNIKLISFVPDLPQYEFFYAKNKLSIKKLLLPLYLMAMKISYNIIDYYVFISKYMLSKFNIRNYSIIEGFIDSNANNYYHNNRSHKKKNVILYSGALLEKFGLKNLIEAFTLIDGDYELWVFGSGEMEEAIMRAAKMDQRIKNWGYVSNEEVLRHQINAKILVNPRFTSQDFTQYSFPSKLLEYLSSGTPVLTTRLESIPDDYTDKFYFIDDESVAGMKSAIERCISKPEEELTLFGKNAQDFVFNNKNNFEQIGKLLKEIDILWS